MRTLMHVQCAKHPATSWSMMTLVRSRGDPKRKKRPVKVLWYFPIIPRLMGLFANKDHAKLMRWHAEERRDDGNAQTPCGWLAVAEN